LSEKRWQAKEQAYFLKRLGELLQEGFSLSEGLSFLKMMQPKRADDIQRMLARLETGVNLAEALAGCGFSEQVVSQLRLSFLHGKLTETLLFCSDFLAEKDKQLQKLRKVLIYPLFLLVFANGMLIAIRQVLLPSLETMLQPAEDGPGRMASITLAYLKNLPLIILGTAALGASLFLLAKMYLKRKSAFRQSLLFCRIPLLSRWVQLYYSFFFCREYAYFFRNGMQLNQIVSLMRGDEGTAWMKEISGLVEEGLTQGDSLTTIIKRYPIFKEEMGWIIYHGELTSQLPIKLSMYSEECFRLLIADIEQKIGWLQPVLFLMVAIIVMAIYLILLMPMLSSLGGMY
jgi:competence protein ComGB